MNVDQIKILRESYMVESTRPDGRTSTTGEYMRFITDCNLEFVTSKDLVMTDDDNGMVHCVCLNEDVHSQADFPVKIISAPYEDIHSVEAIMSQANFEKFLNDGFFNNISGFSADKKKFMIKWSRGIQMQAQQPSKYTPYYTEKPMVINKPTSTLRRHDGITDITSPASLKPTIKHIRVATTENFIDALESANIDAITLNNDIVLNKSINIDKDVVININGNIITNKNGERAFVINKGNVVIKNGKIVADGNDAFFLNGVVEDGGNACSLYLDRDVQIVADDCCVLIKGPDTKLITSANLTSTGSYAAIQGNGIHGNVDIEINGGSITSKDVGVYLPCLANVKINNATITGSTGVYQKSGILNINNSIINGNGEYMEYTYNPNGCNPTGDAVVIEACDYPGGVPTISINGGTFISKNAKSIAYYQQNDEYMINSKFIHSGIFNTDVSEFVADGSSIDIDSEDGYYVVSKS